MGRIHNSRENQNHRIADATPGALLRTCTLAPPACTAAATPTAHGGRGAVNASRGIGRRWRSMAVLIVFAAMLAVYIAPALAAILPDPANIANATGNHQAGGD
uniref:Uncharacterized protein n=1 Tax=Candidatus Methanogaster sp. ANME-2c ERB4 TaxID=2759911 RepID=A0A7G9YKT0_9EURY|nr:hypothetical protein LKGCFIDI_00016 [Methanosarcinales archaeon ANME-2c ERB4]